MECEDYRDPATPELFGFSYNSDGRSTPDDVSSVDGIPTEVGRSRKKKRGRPSMYLTGDPVDSWLDPDQHIEYKIGG